MKRNHFLNLILLILLTVTLIGCQENEGTAVSADRPSPEPIIQATSTTAATAVPTATPLPTTLQADLDATYDMEDFPPDASLVVHFNQPMRTSHRNPLIFTPTVDGSFSWDDTATILTFTPESSFTPGRSYLVNIPSNLKSDSGLTFASLQRWRLQMQTRPEITLHTPAATAIADMQPVIYLNFNRPMDMTSVYEALSITPPLAHTLVWEDDTHVRLLLDEPLAFDTTYEFTVAETAVDQQEFHLATPYQWTYTLKPTLSHFTAPTTADHLAPINMYFNYPVAPASLQDSMHITPAINGDFTWNEDGTVATFTPASQLPASTEYTLSFETPLRTPAGLELPTPETAVFTTPPSILAHTPNGNAIHPVTNLTITFDRLMDAASVVDAFTITPTISGSFSWEETEVTFRPDNGYFDEDTHYTITLADTATTTSGERILSQPYVWDFRTKELETLAIFGYGPNAQILDANGRRAVQFQSFVAAPVNLQFELYSLTLPQFLDSYATGYRDWSGWGERSESRLNTEGTTLRASWQMETAVSIQEWGNVQEVIIPDDVPPGLYILNLVAPQINDQIFLVISSNTLTIKQADEQLLTWVTDINGQSVADIPVRVYAHDGSLLAEGRTNADGLVHTQLPANEEGESAAGDPLLVVAQNGSDITISGLTGSWGWYKSSSSQSSAAYIITDRPIYKPGQTVYFKATVRQDDDALLTLLPADTAVTARIRDSRNNVVQTIELTTNDFGSVNDAFTIAEGAMLGTYHVEIEANGAIHRQPFKVEEYRKPDYEVTVSTNVERVVQGTPITVTVDTRYFFGEPLVHTRVTIHSYNLSENWYGDPDTYTWFDSGLSDINGYTDENGRFTATIRTNQIDDYWFTNEDWSGSLSRATWGIEATVDDGSRQTVSGFAVVHVYDAAARLTLSHNGYIQTPGQSFTIRAQASTIFDEPLANHNLTLSLRRWDSGSYDYTTVLDSVPMTTDENGRASLDYTIAESGYYQLRVEGKDSSGHDIRYNSWIYAFDNFYGFWYGSNNGNLTITPDQTSYAPGDVAQLIVETAVSGPALLVVERGTIHREQLVNLTAPVTMLDLPIQADDVPNIHVSINVWEEQDTTITNNTYSSQPDSNLLTAYARLSVPATDKQLTVTLTPDHDVYAPRDEATFTVRVTNWKGEPVSAEVSLALVDEAIFALSEELSGAIYDAFYFERSNDVATFNSLDPMRYLGGGGGGGGGGDGFDIDGPRQDFPDTAAWFPTLTTDFNGEAIVTVTLPDSLTSWRLTAKAATADTQVGQATANITTSQAIIVRPILPRVLTAGDTAVISAIVHNYTDTPQELIVTFAMHNAAITIHNSPTQTITLPPNASQILGWYVTAEAAGEALVLVTAVPSSNDLRGDAIQLPLTVQPLAVPDVETQIGQFSGQFATTVTIPADALPLSTVEIQLTRSIAGSLLQGLEYLTGYPYGCVEQTMSKALPNAVVGRALFQLGVSNPALQAELPAQISASVQRLYGFQHDDGGWGWWFDDATHDYQTAWVIFGLAQVAEAGYEVDTNVIQRGADWLNENLSLMDARTRAFALYALATAGQPNLAATRELATDLDALAGDTFSIAGLALALHIAGDTVQAQELIELLAETAVTDNGFTYWTGANHDGYYANKTMASDVRSTALALSAFTRIAPGHELESGIVRWLMAQRKAQGWGTTNETSFAIISLTDHLLATSFNETATTPYTITLNGSVVAEGTLGRGEPAISLQLTTEQLNSGTNELAITGGGNGRLYYTINSRIYLAQQSIEAAGSITISRTYFDGDSGKPLETITAGQLVKVQLTVDLPQDGSYIIVEDKLPGGLEALNESLNTTSHEGSYYGAWTSQWYEFGYNYKEVRADRVSFFITEMHNGRSTFTYYARATHTGTFTAMPTEVYAMYNLALWGRSASSTVTIAE
ncbi:MAG: Ig-like domain-containing protein [Chloroflexota bacterium]